MPEQIHIMVAGGFDEDNKKQLKQAQEFARLLGRQVITQGHILLNACRSSFDRVVAKNAEAAIKKGENPNDRIISYVLSGQEPAFTFGNVRTSKLTDWELGSPGLQIPEPIDHADVVVLVGGFRGTQRAANWARISGKPLLPITRFGGAAEEIYAEELNTFQDKYATRIDKNEFEDLAQLTSAPADFAQTVISLAERIRTSRSVFVIMSFSEDPALDDAYDSYKVVCEDFEYECYRVDEESNVPRILPEILTRISGCAFTIVDLSDEKANVYYELGYAEALKKPLIVTAKQGTKLPFDVKDLPVIFWESQKGLKEQLRKKIEDISARQGR